MIRNKLAQLDKVRNHQDRATSSFYPDTAYKFLLTIEKEFHGVLKEQNTVYRSSFKHIYRYYVVACATCLEWHARTRLASLFVFSPKSIEKDDLGNLTSVSLIHLAVENELSIAILLASSRNISSEKEYFEIFNRIGKSIDVSSNMYDHIHGKLANGTEYNNRLIFDIFHTRHGIVHEIDSYDYFEPKYLSRDWLEHIGLCISATKHVIVGIEGWLREYAPKNFPHLFDRDMSPISEKDLIFSDIEFLQNEILFRLKKLDNASWINDFNAYRAQYKSFIESSTKFFSLTGGGFNIDQINFAINNNIEIAYLMKRHFSYVLRQLDRLSSGED